MLNANASKTLPVGDALLAASRQVWLAGLGAAVVTRDWAGKEARPLLRALVKEGTVVESRAIRFVGDRVETSVTRANALLRQSRTTLQSAMKYAGTAGGLVRRALPATLPTLDLVAKLRLAKPAKAKTAKARTARPAKTRVRNARTVKASKSAKRTVAKATRRAARG
jgi:hypothetical protein